MTRDNDELEYDLSAFEVPEPPEGIADAVVARLGGTSVTIGVPGETRDSKRRGIVVAAVAVACLAAAAGTYALIQGSRRAGPSRGDVVAVRARTLSLDGVNADLDPGAQVKWQRRGSLLDVEQREGAAAWRVDPDTTLRIDAGAMVASVEATGASLRVEVSMNATDARVLGASALTAAAVSMVTVTVYTGQAKVSERGQTVIVQRGETHSVIPPQPAPPPPEPVVAGTPTFDRGRSTNADVRVPAGESSTINVPALPALVELDAGGRCPGVIEYYRDGTKLSGAIVTLTAGLHTYAVRCAGEKTDVATGSFAVVPGGGLTPLARPSAGDPAGQDLGPVVFLSRPMSGIAWAELLPVSGQVLPDATTSIGALDIPVNPDGRFSASVPTPASLTLAVRVEHPQRGIHYVVVRGRPGRTVAATKTCDEVSCVLTNYKGACCAKYKSAIPEVTANTTLAATGTSLSRQDISKVIGLARSSIVSCGDRSTATGTVKVNVKVRPDGKVASISTNQAYDAKVSGCVLDVVKTLTFPVTDDGGSFSYPFVFGPSTAPPANCDAEALKEAGMEHINRGENAAALAKFEASLRCKNDPFTQQLAYMTACGAKNEAKARLYFRTLSPAQQTKFRQVCIRNGIDPADLVAPASSGMGYLEVRSTPAAQVFVDGVDTGMTTPISGSALKLKAGKHKVTFVVGEDRYTYPVNIVDGGAFVLDKILE